MNKILILTVALISGSGAMTACTSSKSGGNSAETVSTGAAHQSETPKHEVLKETPKETVKPTPEKSDEPDVAGKYEALVDSGGLIEGEQILQLKKDKTATFRNPTEDGTSEGTGSWNWDSAKELLTVTLTIEYTPSGMDSGMDEGKKPEISKAVFELKKEGKNLKVVSQTFAPDVPAYKGSLFRKL